VQINIFAGGVTPSRDPLSNHLKTIGLVVGSLVSLACDLPSSTAPEDRSPGGYGVASTEQRDRALRPSDGRVTLVEALAFAEEHSPAMLIAAGEVEVGGAEVEAAKQAQPFNPTLSVGLGQRRQAGGTGLDAQVGLQQQLEIAGQRKKRQDRARLFRELTALGLDAAAWSVHADVHWAFERALLAEQRLALAQERVAVSRDLLRMARRRVEVGDESGVVVDIAVADLALAENAELAAAADVETSRMALALAVGSEAPLQPIGKLDPLAPTLGGAELARRATGTNPTLRQADAAARVAEADLVAARREAWPSPTVGVSFAREGSTSTPANFSPASTIWMGTLQIPIPAFARNQGAVARNRAQVRVADARRRASSVQFNSMVGAAAARVDAAAGRSRALETGVVSASERSLAALRRAYEVGELGFLDVAQALERLWAARERALDVRGRYYDAFADLERLVGPVTAAGSLLEDSPATASDEGDEP
jgi:cobalt-zinc-cadmium efflux system outer membrane protein